MIKIRIATASLFIVSLSCQSRSYNAARVLDSKNTGESTLARKSFDVNDVSILSPHVGSAAALEKLPKLSTFLAADSSKAELLFHSILEQGQDGRFFRLNRPEWDEAKKLANWRIVGTRVDLCSNILAGETACKQQVRLVAQPFLMSADTPQKIITGDAAIHLIFNADQKPAAAIVDSLEKLKSAAGASTNGLPLGVHPGFISGGNIFLEKYNSFLAEYANLPTIKFAALMGSVDLSTFSEQSAWVFSTGNVKGDKYIRLDKISLYETPFSIFDALSGEGNTFKPLPTITDNTKQFSLASQKQLGGGDAEEKRLDSVRLNIVNPHLVGLDNSDCASCHLPQKGFKNQTPKMDGMRLKQIVSGSNSKSFDAITFARFVDSPKGSYNLRQFGHDENGVSVSTRAIAESAVVAEFINRNVLKITAGNFTNARQNKTCDEPKLDVCLSFGGALPCYAKADVCK